MAGMSVGGRARAKTDSNWSSMNTQSAPRIAVGAEWQSGGALQLYLAAARTERCELFRVLMKTCQTEIQKISFGVVRGKRSRVRSGSVRVADVNLACKKHVLRCARAGEFYTS